MLLGWHLCTSVYKLTLNVTVWFNVPLNTLEVIWATIFSTNHLAAVKTQCSQHWRIHSQSLSTTCWVWTVNIWRRSMRQSSQRGLQAQTMVRESGGETPLTLNAFWIITTWGVSQFVLTSAFVCRRRNFFWRLGSTATLDPPDRPVLPNQLLD